MDSNATGIDSANGWIVAAVSALWSAGYQNASGRIGAVRVTVVTHIRLVTARVGICVAHQSGGALTAETARSVVADGSVVTRMESALVHIYAYETAVVFEALFATTGRLSVPDDARAVRTAVDAIARILAQKVDALPVIRTVSVVKTIDFLAAILSVVGVTRVEAHLRALALDLMVDHCAQRVGTARVYVAWVDAFGNSIKIASARGVLRTV